MIMFMTTGGQLSLVRLDSLGRPLGYSENAAVWIGS